MITRCKHCSQFILDAGPCPCTLTNRYQVRPNWEGKGWRLYYGDDRSVVQVDGEINGKVWRTRADARAYCQHRFGETATYERR